MRILWIYAASLVVVFLVTAVASTCPSVCECKWKGGKQTVECKNRGLITLPSNIDPETQVLDLSGSNLQTLPREAFKRANLLNLQKIYLSGCRIGQIDPTALRGLTNLIELDLGNNMLTDVPSRAFRDVISLRELKLNDNPIQKIDDQAFDSVPGLTKLDLSNCRLQTIADRAFQGLDQLSHLRLGGNQLTQVQPQVIATLTRLHGVELHGNPWVCDCRLRYVREWLQQHNIPSPVAATCASPPRLQNRPLVLLETDDFACAPQVADHNGGYPRRLHATTYGNATLSCAVTAVPEAEITWLWQGQPVANTSDAEAAEADAAAGVGSPTAEAVRRAVVITEQGKYDKTSHLRIQLVSEADAGEFLCVASNSAGLVQINLTLDVETLSPVASGLDAAQITGLGVALLILLTIIVALLLLAALRRRDHTAKDNEKVSANLQLPPNGGVGEEPMKSPSLSALEYGQVTYVNPNSPGGVVTTVLNKPDLIHDARNNLNNLNNGDYYHQCPPRGRSSPPQGRSPPHEQLNILSINGEYQSAQSDSFYPSALWDNVAQEAAAAGIQHQLRQLTESPGSATLTLPHVPLNGLDQFSGVVQPVCADSDAESARSVSIDSYHLPCRIPQQQQQQEYASAPYVPYPADYGLPRTQSPASVVITASATTTTTTTKVIHDESLTPSYAGSKTSINQWSSVESSPASSNNAKSPRFWHRPLIPTGKRNFARDSPDEGYQEECATDV